MQYPVTYVKRERHWRTSKSEEIISSFDDI